LASISAFDIQTLYGDLLARSLSARSIRYTHAVLRSALKQATRWNLILSNPADSVDLPRQDRRQIGVLNVEQARTFVKAISGHPYRSLFALALTTGMRPSEYLGLTWNDLDLDRGTVSVSHTLEWRKGGWQFAETKRSRSRRLVKLQAWVVALLREQVRKKRKPLEISCCSVPDAGDLSASRVSYRTISSRCSSRQNCRPFGSTTCAIQLQPFH
jgi:integrase